MLLALVLAAAPVTISLTPDAVSVDGVVVKASFDDGALNLPAVEQLLRRPDAGPLDVRIDATSAVTFLRVKRVMFSAASSKARTFELRLEGAAPFENAVARSLGVVRVAANGIWVDDVSVQSDAGVDWVQLKQRLPPPQPDGMLTLAVDDTVSMSTLAAVVEGCRSTGHQVGLVPLALAPPAGAAPVTGSIDKEAIRGVIHANRKQVGDCSEKLRAKKPAAAGKVKVRFIIAADGHVASATVEEDAVGDEALGQCLTKAVKTWVFPRPAGGGVVVINYPFTFGPK